MGYRLSPHVWNDVKPVQPREHAKLDSKRPEFTPLREVRPPDWVESQRVPDRFASEQPTFAFKARWWGKIA